MIEKEQLYQGKGKIIYTTTENPNLVIQYFKDDATAFNGLKKEEINGKGVLNNAISSLIFKYLENRGIKTHYLLKLNDREMLVKKVDIFPIEVVMRNVVAGSLAKRLGKEEGTLLSSPILEFYYKNDELGDPMINEDHIEVFELAKKSHLYIIKLKAKRINELLINLFSSINITLVDFKLEFGLDNQGHILLADEISPDGCRLWDSETNNKLDKDRFRRDLGGLEDAYQEVYNRILNRENT